MLWTILGGDETTCDHLRRRNFLKIGALAGTGLTLVDRLRGRARAADSNVRAKPRSAILIFLAGGPSHFETFDPKPQAPAEIRGPYNPIATSVSGLTIAETLPQLARIADRYSLIRSCCHENPGHGGGQRYVQTGYQSASLENELPHDYPVAGSIVAKLRGTINRGLPTFIRCPDSNGGIDCQVIPGICYRRAAPSGFNRLEYCADKFGQPIHLWRAAYADRDGDTGGGDWLGDVL